MSAPARPPANPPASLPASLGTSPLGPPSGFRRWMAFGSGVGIQIEGPRGAESAHIAAARVRPGGARLLGGFRIEDLPRQPAAVWGADVTAFLRKLGLQNTPA